MKSYFKLLGSTLIVCFAMISCDKSSLNPVFDPEVPIVESPDDFSSENGYIKLGDGYIYPLTGSLTNLVSENFVSGGRTYYSYHLKLEILYPGSVVYPFGGGGNFDLSYSINFKFFTDQKNGSLDEVLTVELLDHILSYYKPMDQSYAYDKIAVAFLYGDRSFDLNLSDIEYINYLKSQIRIKSGTVHINSSDESYLISFDGETETGEKVSCHFNDKVIFGEDHQFESQENDFSTTEIPENYIQKGEKYYKLNEGYYFILSPSTYEGNTFHTVQVISMKGYYRYDNNAGVINQHWKSNQVLLQFQFADLNQFQSKTYQVVPSMGINSISGDNSIPFSGFPNDSLLIGYYHIALDAPTTLTYAEDPNYMKNHIALKSGQLEIYKHDTEYEFSGNFMDSQGEEVKVKFRAIPNPLDF